MAPSAGQAKRRTITDGVGQVGELPSNRSFLLLLGLVVAAFFVFSYLDRINQLASVRAGIVSLQNDVAQAEQRNAELKATLAEVAGSAYVGETARAELGLIQPGDDPFVILGAEPSAANGSDQAGGATTPSQPANSAAARGETDLFSVEWWRSLFRR